MVVIFKMSKNMVDPNLLLLAFYFAFTSVPKG